MLARVPQLRGPCQTCLYDGLVVGYLNQGMYDAVEAARLLSVSPNRLMTWTNLTRRRDALLVPSLETLFSFHDLISLRVIAELIHRGVTVSNLATGFVTLRNAWGTDRPLAHRSAVDCVGSVGASFFARLRNPADDWVDIGKGGQGAFQEIIRPDLRGIEYGDDDLAAIWRPADHVWLNPRVQAGASCIDMTRLPTSLIFGLLERGEAAPDVATDYDVDIADVMAAADFERRLAVA